MTARRAEVAEPQGAPQAAPWGRWGARTYVMGIVNCTPDSFSGDGLPDAAAAIAHGLRLAEEGADVLDVGGESTRPGAAPVPVEEELRRVLLVVEALAARTGLPISVHTSKAEVAETALAAGATIINDVWALARDPDLAAVTAHHRATVVLMHNRAAAPTVHALGGHYAGVDYRGRDVVEIVGAPSGTTQKRTAVTPEAIARGLRATCWPARFEVVRPAGSDPPRPAVVVDGAHNGDSADKLAAALRAHLSWERLWLVVGAGVDKDLAAILAPLAPLAAGAWAVAARHPRSRPAPEVAAALATAGVPSQSVPDVAAALREALDAAGPRDTVCVTGSLFVTAEAREALGLVPPGERDPAIR